PPCSPRFPSTTLFRSRRDHPTQHMVQPLELRGVLDRDHIANVTHYAKQAAVAQWVQANTAYFRVGNVVAFFAVLYLGAHFYERLDRKSTRLNSSHVKI